MVMSWLSMCHFFTIPLVGFDEREMVCERVSVAIWSSHVLRRDSFSEGRLSSVVICCSTSRFWSFRMDCIRRMISRASPSASSSGVRVVSRMMLLSSRSVLAISDFSC